MSACTKKRYLKYVFGLHAAMKMYKKYREIQTPYYCKECDAFHLTMKRANKKEFSDVLLFKKGIVVDNFSAKE